MGSSPHNLRTRRYVPTLSRGIRSAVFIATTVLAAVLLLPHPANAEQPEQTANNKTVTQQQIEQQINVLIRQQISAASQQYHWPSAVAPAINVRLPSGSHRLSRCEAPASIERIDRRKYPAGRLRFSAQCHAPKAWKITVQADVSMQLPVSFASRTLTKGHVLEHQDIITKQLDIASLNREFIAAPSGYIGLRVRRQIRDGQLISPAQLSPAYLVVRGDKVIIEASREQFSASMLGEALEGGYLEQQIQVRNISSGKVIKAIVTGAGQVTTLF